MYDHVRKVEQAITVPVVWLKAERDFEYFMFRFTPDRKPGFHLYGEDRYELGRNEEPLV